MHYDLGYFDDETCRLELVANPTGKWRPLCWSRTLTSRMLLGSLKHRAIPCVWPRVRYLFTLVAEYHPPLLAGYGLSKRKSWQHGCRSADTTGCAVHPVRKIQPYWYLRPAWHLAPILLPLRCLARI